MNQLVALETIREGMLGVETHVCGSSRITYIVIR